MSVALLQLCDPQQPQFKQMARHRALDGLVTRPAPGPEQDATGQGRAQLWDRVFSAVKEGESCPAFTAGYLAMPGDEMPSSADAYPGHISARHRCGPEPGGALFGRDASSVSH
jgi:hypothetical protein